jgi:hypothetical protein
MKMAKILRGTYKPSITSPEERRREIETLDGCLKIAREGLGYREPSSASTK